MQKFVQDIDFESVSELLEHVRNIGRRLIHVQPAELTIGNVIRRILGLIREVSETNHVNDKSNNDNSTNVTSSSSISRTSTIDAQNDSGAIDVPLRILDKALDEANINAKSPQEIREDLTEGLKEMIDEVDQADGQIADYALEHIYNDETILTFTSSLTVQRFLLSAAKRGRKFTVIFAEGYPNEHISTYGTIIKGARRNLLDRTENRFKTLTASGVKVVCIPDTAIFTIMPRINKVILPSQSLLPNGSFIAAAGTNAMANAARLHHIPVIVLGAIYRLSPLHPFNVDQLMKFGDTTKVITKPGMPFDKELFEDVDVLNPIFDHIPATCVNLFITNM